MVMNRANSDIERLRNRLALSVWENEGGAPGGGTLGGQYGRRIEADRSWTVYHVFTGIPANARGQAMTGLSRIAATDGMLSLNRRNQVRLEGRGRVLARTPID